MKCIGRKSEYCVLLMGIVLVVSAFDVGMMIVDKENTFIYAIPFLLIIGLLCWLGYYVFFLPTELVLYDEENKMIRVYNNKKTYRDIELHQIKQIKVDNPFSNAQWKSVMVVLKDGDVVETTCISNDNEIMEKLMIVKND